MSGQSEISSPGLGYLGFPYRNQVHYRSPRGDGHWHPSCTRHPLTILLIINRLSFLFLFSDSLLDVFAFASIQFSQASSYSTYPSKMRGIQVAQYVKVCLISTISTYFSFMILTYLS